MPIGNRQLAIGNALFRPSIAQNHLLRALVMPRLITACRLAPGSYWISSARSLSFAAAVRVIHRIHRHAADLWPQAFPARPSGFPKRDILVLDIADLTDGCFANQRHATDLAGWHANLRVHPFLRDQLGESARRPS